MTGMLGLSSIQEYDQVWSIFHVKLQAEENV